MEDIQEKESTCVNCGGAYRLKFCNACGQKTPNRYTIGHVFEEGFHSLTHADRGIFPLIRDLVLHPGRIALDFVEGRRKRHFNLFQYLIIITGVFTFFVSKTDLFEQVQSFTTVGTENAPSERLAQFQQRVMMFMRQYNNLVAFALLPLSSFCAWLLTRKSRFNYAENIVMMIAATAAVSTVSTVVLLVYLFAPGTSPAVYLGMSVLLLIYYYTLSFSEFHGYSIVKSLLLSVATYLLLLVIQMLIGALLGIAYVMLVKQ